MLLIVNRQYYLTSTVRLCSWLKDECSTSAEPAIWIDWIWWRVIIEKLSQCNAQVTDEQVQSVVKYNNVCYKYILVIFLYEPYVLWKYIRSWHYSIRADISALILDLRDGSCLFSVFQLRHMSVFIFVHNCKWYSNVVQCL